jgi:hypothetical protein
MSARHAGNAHTRSRNGVGHAREAVCECRVMGAGIDQDVELAQTMGRALRGLEPFTSRD